MDQLSATAQPLLATLGLDAISLNRMTSVCIVEDNPTVRQTLARWVEDTPGFRCVCVFSSGEEALQKIPAISPDVVLMDIQLPGISGIACTSRLRQLLPNLQIIMVTVYRDYDKITQALKAGACGYLLKRSTREEVVHAISEVRAGGAPMSGEIARRLIESFREPIRGNVGESEHLSPREEEILDLLCQGYANKEVADRLNVSVETIRTHLKRIYQKLHVRSRTEAVLKYLH